MLANMNQSAPLYVCTHARKLQPRLKKRGEVDYDAIGRATGQTESSQEKKIDLVQDRVSFAKLENAQSYEERT